MRVVVNLGRPEIPEEVARWEPAPDLTERPDAFPAIIGASEPTATLTKRVQCDNPVCDAMTGELIEHWVFVDSAWLEPHLFPIPRPMVLCHQCATDLVEPG